MAPATPSEFHGCCTHDVGGQVALNRPGDSDEATRLIDWTGRVLRECGSEDA
jgi:hypothetical protein